jgi:enamine deaminase RidA (YjgF/YER057c/UK114 family)
VTTAGGGAERRGSLEVVNPGELGAPRGYSHGILAPAGGRLLFVAGQIGGDADQRLVEGGFAPQFERALENVVAVVRAAGGAPEDLARLTLYVTDRREYLAALPAVGERYRRVMGRHFPAMALVEVQALLEPGARVEIEATAVLPAPPAGEVR